MKKGKSLPTLQKQNDYKETHKQLYANKLITQRTATIPKRYK